MTKRWTKTSVPAPGAFAVTVAGAARGLAASDPVAVAGKTVTLTLASAVAHGEAVTLAYTVPAAQPLRNLAGLDAAGFAGREVANATPDSDGAGAAHLLGGRRRPGTDL